MNRQLGRRVVGTPARTAPKLPVKFQCPKCYEACTLDAYDGPPSCFGGRDEGHHKATEMLPVMLML